MQHTQTKTLTQSKRLKQLYKSATLTAVVGCLLFLMTQHSHATDNLFEKNYKAQSTYALHSMQANPDTKMYVSDNKQKDNISMLENGYDMMGSSGFKYTDFSPEHALAHAKSIKADVVLVYTKHAAQGTGDARMALIKEAAKTGQALTEADVAEPKEEYHYYASYWAKIPTPLLGVHVIKLASKNKTTQATEQTKGLKVLAVIKDSPAAKAGLQHGDVLLQLDDHTLEKAEDLAKVVHQHQGETVNIHYARQDEVKQAKASINQR